MTTAIKLKKRVAFLLTLILCLAFPATGWAQAVTVT